MFINNKHRISTRFMDFNCLCLYNNSGFGGSCGPSCQSGMVAFGEGDYTEGLGRHCHFTALALTQAILGVREAQFPLTGDIDECP